jgi:hypothetical protein
VKTELELVHPKEKNSKYLLIRFPVLFWLAVQPSQLPWVQLGVEMLMKTFILTNLKFEMKINIKNKYNDTAK